MVVYELGIRARALMHHIRHYGPQLRVRISLLNSYYYTVYVGVNAPGAINLHHENCGQHVTKKGYDVMVFLKGRTLYVKMCWWG